MTAKNDVNKLSQILLNLVLDNNVEAIYRLLLEHPGLAKSCHGSMFATENIEIWQCFLECGADINAISSTGSTLLMDNLILNSGEYCLLHIHPRKSQIQWLIDHGADVNFIDKNSRTILSYALPFPDIMRHLIRHHLDLTDKHKKNLTSYSTGPGSYTCKFQPNRVDISNDLHNILNNYSSFGSESTIQLIKFILTLDVVINSSTWGAIITKLTEIENICTFFNDVSYDVDTINKNNNTRNECKYLISLIKYINSLPYNVVMNKMQSFSNVISDTNMGIDIACDIRNVFQFGYLAIYNYWKSTIIENIPFTQLLTELYDLHDESQNNLLHFALQNRALANPCLINTLIYDGCNIKKKNEYGKTPYQMVLENPDLFDRYNSSGLRNNTILIIEDIVLNDTDSYLNQIPYDCITTLRQFYRC
jgi:ankyrin repeat protein